MEQQEVILLIVGFNMAKDTIKITTKVAKTSHLQEGGKIKHYQIIAKSCFREL